LYEGGGGVEAEALIRPVVEAAGLELDDVSFRRESGRQILRVTVDREGGLDLEAVAEISEKISRRLDLEDFGRGRYELEVSTPGIERPLRTPTQFRRAVGSRVRVKTASPEPRVHEGTLVGAGGSEIVLEVEGAKERIPLPDVTSARTVADWDAELKRSRT
jgi:ribosome maturation factor RimP